MLVVVSLQLKLEKKTVCAKKDSVFLRLSHAKSEDQDHQDMWCPGSSCNLAKVFEPTTHKGNSIRATWAMSVLQTLTGAYALRYGRSNRQCIATKRAETRIDQGENWCMVF